MNAYKKGVLIKSKTYDALDCLTETQWHVLRTFNKVDDDMVCAIPLSGFPKLGALDLRVSFTFDVKDDGLGSFKATARND